MWQDKKKLNLSMYFQGVRHRGPDNIIKWYAALVYVYLKAVIYLFISEALCFLYYERGLSHATLISLFTLFISRVAYELTCLNIFNKLSISAFDHRQYKF